MDIRERKDLIALDDGGVLASKFSKAEVNEEKGEIVALVSTPSVDSYGDIIRQGPNDKGKGWVLGRFNGAPVMLWTHNTHGQMNVSAPETKASVRPHAEYGEALFLEPVKFDQPDPDAVALEGKIRRKVIVENSVGFTSDNHAWIRDDDDRITGMEFFEQVLLELSWVNRGANPDTTTIFKSMMSRHPHLGSKASTDDNSAAEVARKDLDATIRQMNERIKELEGLAIAQSVALNDLQDSKQAQRVIAAQDDQSKAIDALLQKLGK